MEDGIVEDRLACLDTDYQSAMTMASVILRHNAHVFLTLPKADTAQPASSAATTRTTLQQRQFLEALPPEFDRQTYTAKRHRPRHQPPHRRPHHPPPVRHRPA